MKFFHLNCGVPGGFGSETIYDKNQIPWLLVHPHIIFDGWLGGQILTISECVLVAKELMDSVSFGFTGITSYEYLNIQKSDIFEALQPETNLPDFFWMKVESNCFNDDIAICYYKNLYNQLIISERFYQILQKYNLGNYKIELAELS